MRVANKEDKRREGQLNNKRERGEEKKKKVRRWSTLYLERKDDRKKRALVTWCVDTDTLPLWIDTPSPLIE